MYTAVGQGKTVHGEGVSDVGGLVPNGTLTSNNGLGAVEHE